MKILYFGSICDYEIFRKKEEKQHPSFIAHYMFERALCDEFMENEDLEIKINSIYQTEYYPKDRLVFNRKKTDGIDYLSFINIPYIKELSYFISTFVTILFWWVTNRKHEDKCIYLSTNYPPVSLAIVFGGWVLKVKKVITLTDLPLYIFSKEKVEKMKWYKKIMMKPYLSLTNKLQTAYDAYILFSREMNKVVNPNNKPFFVMEGIFNSKGLNLRKSNNKVKAIAHAGTLNMEKGGGKILDVFNLFEDPYLELWLFGKGDMVDEILKRSLTDNRIKYFGFLPRNEIFEYLKEAKLLINLRDPSDIYTKYSFPSKMFEFMVTGTPVLTTKLAGIPSEYYRYLYAVDDYDSERIKNNIQEVLEQDESEIECLGLKAKEFIINKKNSKKQCRNVTNFLSNVL